MNQTKLKIKKTKFTKVNTGLALVTFLFGLYFSAFGNGVANAGNTNARIANPREQGVKRSGSGIPKY